MTNAEKYKTVEERTKAFARYCNMYGFEYCGDSCTYCQFAWLEQEVEEDDI